MRGDADHNTDATPESNCIAPRGLTLLGLNVKTQVSKRVEALQADWKWLSERSHEREEVERMGAKSEGKGKKSSLKANRAKWKSAGSLLHVPSKRCSETDNTSKIPPPRL